MQFEEDTFFDNLIAVVRKHPIIYDKNHKDHYKVTRRDETWSKIGEECGRSQQICKHRWKLLRERFCKELKRNSKASSTTASIRLPWRYFDKMMFLEGIVVTRPRRKHPLHSSQDGSLHSEEQSDTLISIKSPRKKTKIHQSIAVHSNTGSIHDSSKKVKKTKYENMNALYSNLETSLDSLGKVINNLTDVSVSGEAASLQAMDILLRDLPPDLKDEFLAEAYANVMKYRALARNRLQ